MWSKRISRRTILKAGGVALTLPLLEAMMPRRVSAAVQPKRMVNIGATLGFYTPSWLPETTGFYYENTEYLSVLQRHRRRYTILSGLSHAEQVGRQPHNSEITWLTAQTHPGQDGFRNTISLDQAAGDYLGYVTRARTITLGTMTPQSQSYTATGVMVPAESSATRVFENMFLEGTPDQVAREKARLRDGASILDHLADQRAVLAGNLGADDKYTLEAYFDAVRHAEVQLGKLQEWADRAKPAVDEAPPVDPGGPEYLIGRIRSHFSLIPLLLETDTTRVVSVMLQDHSLVPADVAGAAIDQHNLSHHGKVPEKIVQLRNIEIEIIKAFRDLLDDLHERNLLDSTSVLFGSNLGNASSHEAKHLPILVAGGGFSHGEHRAYGSGEEDAPLSNLFVTLLRRMGVETDSFAQSTGALDLSSPSSSPGTATLTRTPKRSLEDRPARDLLSRR